VELPANFGENDNTGAHHGASATTMTRVCMVVAGFVLVPVTIMIGDQTPEAMIASAISLIGSLLMISAGILGLGGVFPRPADGGDEGEPALDHDLGILGVATVAFGAISSGFPRWAQLSFILLVFPSALVCIVGWRTDAFAGSPDSMFDGSDFNGHHHHRRTANLTAPRRLTRDFRSADQENSDRWSRPDLKEPKRLTREFRSVEL